MNHFNTYNHPNNFTGLADITKNMTRPLMYFKDNLQSQLRIPQFAAEQSGFPIANPSEYENQLTMTKRTNTNPININFSINLPTSPIEQPLPTNRLVTTNKGTSMPEYMSQIPYNPNASLNQILGMTNQVVMPPTDYSSQTIPINNLPSLNNLAFSTVFNQGVSRVPSQLDV